MSKQIKPQAFKINKNRPEKGPSCTSERFQELAEIIEQDYPSVELIR